MSQTPGGSGDTAPSWRAEVAGASRDVRATPPLIPAPVSPVLLGDTKEQHRGVMGMGTPVCGSAGLRFAECPPSRNLGIPWRSGRLPIDWECSFPDDVCGFGELQEDFSAPGEVPAGFLGQSPVAGCAPSLDVRSWAGPWGCAVQTGWDERAGLAGRSYPGFLNQAPCSEQSRSPPARVWPSQLKKKPLKTTKPGRTSSEPFVTAWG